MTDPLVSIVIPTLNSQATLARAIDSIRAQTHSHWELIIVDGRSSDRTPDIVSDYRADLGERLTMIQEENRGCCVARNTGIDAARGEFVAFLDSDDEFLSTKLERQLELFRLRPELGLVYSDFAHIDTDGARHQSTFQTHAPLALAVPSQEIAPGLRVCGPTVIDFLIRRYFIATIVGMVRRDVLGDDLRFLPEPRYGLLEWVFYLDIVRRTRVGYVNEPLCLHHMTDGSITRTSRIRNSLSHRALLTLMRTRYAGISPHVDDTLRGLTADACRQLGYDNSRMSEHAAAVRYFAEALRYRCQLSSISSLVRAAAACLIPTGRRGREPLSSAGSLTPSDGF